MHLHPCLHGPCHPQRHHHRQKQHRRQHCRQHSWATRHSCLPQQLLRCQQQWHPVRRPCALMTVQWSPPRCLIRATMAALARRPVRFHGLWPAQWPTLATRHASARVGDSPRAPSRLTGGRRRRLRASAQTLWPAARAACGAWATSVIARRAHSYTRSHTPMRHRHQPSCGSWRLVQAHDTAVPCSDRKRRRRLQQGGTATTGPK